VRHFVRFAWLTAAALVSVSVTPAIAAPKSGKPVVAIYSMDDVARSGKAEEFSRMVETAITATSKFRVIEREQLDKLVGEQARAKAGLVTTRTPGKVGGFEGADYLIYGSITSVGQARKANIGASVGNGLMGKFGGGLGLGGGGGSCADNLVTFSIDIKITDADSGEVKYVTRIDQTGKAGTCGGGDGQIDTATLMRGAADKVATALVTSIYPIQVAAVQPDGSVVLNYGEGALVPGAVLGVYAKGAAIVDPATGESIGSSETKLGYVRVTEVTGRISKAIPISQFSGAPAVGSIVRPANPADAQGKGKKR
jgi:curli biogenesis system outer membrane secretion channel CsgG